MFGVVSKPQFDLDVFKKGDAIHVKAYNKPKGYEYLNTNAIIRDINPLEIEAIYVDPNKEETMSVVIKITSVTRELASIKPMEVRVNAK